jgi:hypothetical protein
MTYEEAQKLARILSQADGGCPVCVSDLTELVSALFPEFTWSFNNENSYCEVKEKS